ncbi:PTS sugar transporter subunit IIC [Listeria booriae]|uniref:PTS sugar transporter subunit IIC n=1 Tax=Listeria booriae TaxID=1552123 RepID=UPI001627FEC5|nr:PTS sugar transporter subunit IIC [Listeria booriae]MBC2163778.1 PTS sugar transporter subunit IIC [Listeria booriae]
MQTFMNFLEKYLSIPMAKLSEQRHLRAIRDGVVSSLPFIIVGSMFLIIAFPPVPKSTALFQWATEHKDQILIPYQMTMAIMSLYISFGIGYNLAKSYKLDPLSGGQIAVASFLLTLTPYAVKDVGLFMPMGNLGGHGLFMAMIVSIFSVEVMRFCKKRNITIKMPDQVPPSVARSFEALIPVAIVLLFITLITVVLGINVHTLVDNAVAPIVKTGDSLFGVLLPVFLITFFWSFGIHGVSVVGAIARPIWELYLGGNAAAVADGNPMPYVAPETFFQWFVWIGGSGATLGLVLAMLFFSKSSYSKALGKTTLIPSIFNINEPVIFGVPIVLNPMLIIPFITIPLITTTISYFATTLGFISPTYVMAPWTLPAPIGAYLATGGDWRAIVLVVVNIFISFLIYTPFFKMYDQKLLDEEQAQAEENKETHSSEPNMA